MSSLTVRASSSSTHVDRTKDSTRSDVVSGVIVLDMRKLSPTVKGFTLQVEDNSLSFKCGQWVDLSIPSEDVVGGYSFTSPPHQLKEQGTVTLAIQTSDHPPTLWMNNKCKMGDRLLIRVGGDFTYDPPSNSPADILLIGGGVGINPLFAMLQHHTYLQQAMARTLEQRGRAHLLYSARSREELLFKDHIDGLVVHSSGLIKANYFVTREEYSGPHIRGR
ncbi:oxidoreductase NAD-binding domain-containing protein 1-like isoform X2 [Halichondria panicea]|uniref:oxidoreductase NAD-binding domain-containing protein 1-like isoform X2 n=1 Tax=Halichondria panicea TaxID=6063 RepID=UPI00312BA7E5